MNTRAEPFLAFGVLLALLMAASFLIQLAGFLFDVSLVRYAMYVALLPCLGLAYGYFFSPSWRNIEVGILLAALLACLGIDAAVKTGAKCPHKAMSYGEFDLCYQ